MELKIYNQSGVLKLAVSTSSSSTLNQELMTENAVSASFTHPGYVPLDVNDYVMLLGVKYSIKKEYKPKQKNTQAYDYSVKFYAPEHDAQQVMYLNLTDGQYNPQFSLDGSPREHMQKWVDNMNRIYGSTLWSIGDVIVADNHTIEYNNLTCWDALTSISETFGTEWWADGFVMNLSRCERGEQVELGYMQGLTSLTQSENSNDVKFFTRLIPLGSTKNIDASRYGFSRLQLPDKAKYVDRNTHYGLYEHVEESAFAEIFPHYTGTVTSVRSEEKTGEDKKPFTVYYFKDGGMTFDPSSKDNEIGGLVKHVSFHTGNLAGREFEANYNSTTKEWEIINTYPSDEVQIPGGNLIPAVGNKYIPWNFRMPVEYEIQAEKDFKAAVDDFLSKYSDDISKYGGDTDYIYIDKNKVSLSLGQRVRLLSDKYFSASEGSRETRMTKVVRKLDNLSIATVECTNQVGKGWKSQVDSSLNQLKYVVAVQKDAEIALDILKSWDGRELNDYRVLSALRTLMEIKSRAISRVTPDTAQEIIIFLKGIEANGIIKALAGLKVTAGISTDTLTASGDIAGNNIEATENISGKNITATKKVSAETVVASGAVKGNYVDATEDVSGKNVLASEGVAGKTVTATDTVKGNNVQAVETVSGKNVVASEKVTTLNLLVQALADTYDLNVSHVAMLFRTIVKDYISSEQFIPGFTGNGMKLYKALSGDWNLELDNLTVRKAMTVFELIISKIRAVNGGLVISPANGKVKSVLLTNGIYRLEIEDDMMFVADDLVRCQSFSVKSGVKYYWVRITSVSGSYIFINATEFTNSLPAIGDDLVQFGNKTNKLRQGLLYLTAAEDGKPRISVLDGVNSTDLTGKTKVILGCLDDIVDIDFPADSQPQGYGLYAANAFLKGIFILRNGKTFEEELSDKITAVQTAFEIREGQISAKVTEVTTKATQAATSATNAKASETAASGSATLAKKSADDAAVILKDVTVKESSITQTAGQIATKVTEVNTKVTEANTAATNAKKSETAAGGSATAASGSAANAKTSADNAAAKLTIITEKESSINQTASQISTKVTEVTKKATEAATSATNAAGSATTVGAKAGEAATSATNAKASADSAAAKLTTITQKESSINQTASNITLQVTEVTTKASQASTSAANASNAAELAMAMSQGKMLYRDPSFEKGNNGIAAYDNSSKGVVTVTRVSGIAGNPNGSGYCLKIVTTAAAAPGWGGWFLAPNVKANQRLVYRFIANIPIGRSLSYTRNSAGNGVFEKWLTSTVGTGKWEEYAYVLGCGASGAFSGCGHFYLTGGATPTVSTPLIWYLAYATVYDVTDAEVDYIADAAAKYTTKTEHSSSITQLSDKIELKVAKTDFNALGNRVSNAETTITQHTGQIALKAAQSDVTALGTRMSSAEAKITPDAIKLTVKSQTDSIVSAAIKRTEVWIDATGLDQSKYYPVTMLLHTSIGTYTISVDRELAASCGKPSWSTHPNGFSVLCRWTTNACGWGAREVKRTILDYTSSFASVVPIGSIGQLTNWSEEYIYVRGGSKYRIVVEGVTGASIVLRTSGYTHTDGTYTQTAPVLTAVTTPVPDIAAVNTRITNVETQFEIREGQISAKVTEVTTKATQAATSATNARTSETNAATSASTASSKATAAANSASDAAAKLATITTKETSINQTASQITIQASTVTTKTAEAVNAAELAAAMSKGRMLYRDPTFESGLNSTGSYALVGSRAVVAITGCPNRLAKGMRIIATGWNSATDLRIGGFLFSNPSRANAVFVVRIVANIPVGRSIQNYHNSYGAGGTTKWLTSQAGTGKWQEYACKVTCGASGTFSTVNHFALTGGVAPTAAAPVTWYVAYATVFDTTDVDDVPTVDEVKAGLTATANTITIFGKAIVLTGAVTADTIAANAVTAVKIAANSITADKIAANAITAVKIAAGVIDATKINVTSIQAAVVTAAKISALNITTKNLTVTNGAKIGNFLIADGGLYAENTVAIIGMVNSSYTTHMSAGQIVIDHPSAGNALVVNGGLCDVIFDIKNYTLRAGGVYNAPGVLWAGRINRYGSVESSWGYGAGYVTCSREGRGIYRFSHSLNHNSYYVMAMATPYAEDDSDLNFCMIKDKGATYFHIHTVDAGRNWRDMAFEVCIVGNN